MRHLIIILAAAAIMALGFAASLVMIGDQNRLKQLLIGHVERQTGRQLAIDGEVSIRLFPRLRIEARQIRLSAPPDSSAPEVLSSDLLSAEVRLLPLMRGRVETSEISLQKARISLWVDEGGFHSFGGLLRRDGRQGVPGIGAGGPVRLEDIEVQIGALGLRPVPTIQADRVELDGLGFDRALDLNFSGLLGRPPILEDVSIKGLLFLPAGGESFRLVDMRLRGRFAGSDSPFELFGLLSFSAAPPLSVVLSDGRLFANGVRLASVEGRYESGERPYFHADVMAEELDGPDMLRLLSANTRENWADVLLSWVSEHDLDLRFAAEQLTIGPHRLTDPQFVFAASDGVGTLESAAAALPGAVLAVRSHILSGTEQADVLIEARLDIDDLAMLLAAAGSEIGASGTGHVSLRPAPDSDPEALASADLVMFDGSWTGLTDMRRLAGLAPSDRFELLQAALVIYPDAISFPVMDIESDGVVFELSGLALRHTDLVSGAARVRLSSGEVHRLVLGGTTEAPRFSVVEDD